MNTQVNPFQPVLDSLLDGKKEFPRKHFLQFSDLGTLELKTLLDIASRRTQPEIQGAEFTRLRTLC